MKNSRQYSGTGCNRHCIAAAFLALAIIFSGTPGFAGEPAESAKTKTASDGAVTAFAQAVSAFAETVTASTEIPDKTDGLSRWSLETSLTFHIVNIYMLKATYQYSDRVELSIGQLIRTGKTRISRSSARRMPTR